MLSNIPEIAENAYLMVTDKFEDTNGVNQRRTNNTMGINETDKMTNNDLQNTTQKTMIQHHVPPFNT
jgi:hypothetical protein